MSTIVICGTPGTGKSTLIDCLKKDNSLNRFNFINLSQFATENNCISGRDEALMTDIIDEDKLSEKLEIVLKEKHFTIIETIHADLVPPDLVEHVFVCRTDNTKLYDRLKSRAYNNEKLSNNVQAEIFQTVYDEAIENFTKSRVTSLINNNKTDLDKNVNDIIRFISTNLTTCEN